LFSIGELTDVLVPVEVTLGNAYPNPFIPTTSISYSIPERMDITVAIYDVTGRVVAELVNSTVDAGVYNVTWEASNQASGIYFIRMVTGETVQSQKLMLIK